MHVERPSNHIFTTGNNMNNEAQHCKDSPEDAQDLNSCKMEVDNTGVAMPERAPVLSTLTSQQICHPKLWMIKLFREST